LTEDNLEDVTNGSSTPEQLAKKEGWFVSLEANKGEKVTGGNVVAYGQFILQHLLPLRGAVKILPEFML